MIRRVQIRNYRALRAVDVRLDRFHLLIGPNASGKSTFFDALAFVRDILVADVPRAFFGDARLGIAPRCADPLELTWQKQGARIEIALDLDLSKAVSEGVGSPAARYEIAIQTAPEVSIAIETFFAQNTPAELGAEPPREQFPLPLHAREPIIHEPRSTIPDGWKKIVEKTAKTDRFSSETKRWVTPFKLGPQRSTLGSLPEDVKNFPAALFAKRLLAQGIFVLSLDAHAMRRPAPAGLVAELASDGSNLPWIVERVARENPERFEAWQDHVRTALPDIRKIETRERPEDRSRYLVVHFEGGLAVPAWLVSDGTLRLLALTFLAYAPLPASLVLVEEPENGLHPQAIEPVVQSLKSIYTAQVLCASHSPVVLGLLEPRDLLCFSKDATGAVDIVRGDQHPRLQQWREDADLSLLFASGVLS
ncbi:MAG: AAA family ATPase [Geminicoccaceae bacterium]|nr:AAA family ATPase [Geminicoccaceae bacterium]